MAHDLDNLGDMTTRVTTDRIVEAYQRTGSVWKAAEALGLSGQTVHSRLAAYGHKMGTGWEAGEVDKLHQLAGDHTIGQIADTLGRSYASVACKLSELGVSGRGSAHRPVKIPRGQGYDKATMRKHLRAIEFGDKSASAYCRANGLKIEPFVRAAERHYPERWAQYRQSHTDLDEVECAYCSTLFYPSTKKHRYCSRKCGTNARTDESYFGGNRANTIGLAEETCQLCGKQGVKGLSSHHMLGKENDPDNEHLLALCPGCHQLVTMLGGKAWTAQQWESLISLALIRKHGHEFVRDQKVLEVCVDIDYRDGSEYEG